MTETADLQTLASGLNLDMSKCFANSVSTVSPHMIELLGFAPCFANLLADTMHSEEHIKMVAANPDRCALGEFIQTVEELFVSFDGSRSGAKFIYNY